MDNILSVKRENFKAALERAVGVLKKGGIVSYPTETFYGLGVKFDDEGALKRLFALKGRPAEKAMPLIIGGEEELKAVACEVNETAERLIKRYWPGPLTILLPAKKGLPRFITYRGKVAVRVPGESFALSLARAAGFPITATSANPSGKPPARNAEAVKKYFGEGVGLIIDCGETPGGLPSTIVDAAEGRAKIVRKGVVDINNAGSE